MDVDLGEMVRDSRCISIQLQSRGNRSLAQEGLTEVQARVLLFIMAHAPEGVSPTDVHRELNFSLAAASGIIKRLREKGYVRVEAYRLDERRKLLFATDKGRRARDVMDAALRAIPEQLYRGFTPEELGTLMRLQKKMLANLADTEVHSILEG